MKKLHIKTSYTFWHYSAFALALFIYQTSHAAIKEAGFIEIGGIEQWVQIQGDDEHNPILLWLNGGPGASTIPDMPAFASWEKHFTMVMWDQRGEGKTFEKYGRSRAGTMTISRMSLDGIELAEYLKTRIPGAKIVLLGHSWGSILGIHMIRQRPDLFAAYVGTGQVTSLPRQFEAAYPLLLERAKSLGNVEAQQELLSVGPPSASNGRGYGVVNKWGERLEPSPPPLPTNARNVPSSTALPQQQDTRPGYLAEGRQFSADVLGKYMPIVNLPALGTDFEVPIFFFQGKQDLITTTSIVRKYYDKITAPEKAFVTFPAGGHDVVFRVKYGFLEALINKVKPVLIP